jgi:nucleotide-binding universal stress UspA family protein
MTDQLSGPVVAGVDDSDDSRAAVDWAAREALRRHVALRLVHGHQAEVPLSAADAVLARAADAVSVRVPVERALVGGAPAGVLVEESARARLVVVGGRGRGGFPGLLTGSVATQVAAHAHCPVVVVRSGGDPAGPVVVGVDGSPQSTTALGFAFEHASDRGLALLAVYAWRGLPTTNLGPVTALHWTEAEAAEEARRMLAEQLAGWSAKYPDARVEQRPVFSFNPAETLVELSGVASLVVVGSRGHGGFTGLLVGSVSRALIHHAPGPVAVVHPYRPG